MTENVASWSRSQGAPPRLVVLTDRRASEGAGRSLMATVEAAIEGGARTILLREKDQPATDRAALARELQDRLEPVGGQLWVASDVAVAAGAGATAVHLTAADPCPPDPPDGLLIGRSCHGADEVRRAAAEGAGYATLSPIFPSPSKPGYGPALGPQALAGHRIPVYALGGITSEGAAACLAAGAAGVAVMGGVMAAADPAATAAELVTATGA